MGTTDKPEIGSMAWRDLTVDDAEGVRDFYKAVVGWDSEDVGMGEYNDFSMVAPGSREAIAGICHARGSNAKIPAQWMMYIVVADVDQCARSCTELGGEVLDGPRPIGQSRFCVIRDPAGAVCALYQA